MPGISHHSKAIKKRDKKQIQQVVEEGEEGASKVDLAESDD